MVGQGRVVFSAPAVCYYVIQSSVDMKSESEVGKTSYGTVRENLDRCTCWAPVTGHDVLSISLWRGRGMRWTATVGRLIMVALCNRADHYIFAL